MTTTRIIGIDPAIVLTGYSVLDIETNSAGKTKPKLSKYGIIDTKPIGGKEAGTLQRARFVVNKFSFLTKDVPKENIFVMIEEPPRSSYKGKGGGIGRVLSIYPVMAVAYSLVGYCSARFITHDTIFPIEWQRHDKGEEESKIGSLRTANQFLKHCNYMRVLAGKKDENIADAVNISLFAYSKLFGATNDGAWNLQL